MKGKISFVLPILLVLVLWFVVFGACAPAPEAPAPEAPAPQAPAPEEKIYEWRMQHYLPRGFFTTPFAEEFAENVRVASEGRIDIQVSYAGELMPVLEEWEAVSKGVLPINFSYGAYWGGKTNGVSFLSNGIEFTLPTTRHVVGLRQRPEYAEVIRKAYAKDNIYFMGYCMPTLDKYIISKKPLTKLDDLKGLKVRATGSAAEILTKAGCSTVYFPAGEQYEALDRGVVDACAGSDPAAMHDFGLHEAGGKYVMPIGFGGEEFIANLTIWNELPDDLKIILFLAAEHYMYSSFEAVCYLEAEAMRDFETNWGITISDWSEEDFRQLSECALEVLDGYSAKDPLFAEGAAILKDYMRYIGVLRP